MEIGEMHLTFRVEKCESCGGRGLVPNPYFEFCAKLGKTPEDMGGCNRCEFRELCYRGEHVICEECNGTGIKLIPIKIAREVRGDDDA